MGRSKMPIRSKMITPEYVIDIDELSKLSYNSKSEMQKRIGLPSIHKFQPRMHDKDDKVHEPSMFSIGPYHYGSPSTISMQKAKWGYLEYILSLNPENKLSDYIEAMRGIEKQTRKCYADEINMDSSEFLKMMLLDGCFVLVTLHGMEGIVPLQENIINMDENKDELTETNANQNNKGNEHQEEYTHDTRTLYATFITADLLFLENQIPFFVVTKIYELVTGGKSATCLPTENIVESVENLIKSYPKGIRKSNRPKKFHHLLHLCHAYFRPSQVQVNSNLNNPMPRFFHHFRHLQNTIFNRNKTITSFDDDLGILVSDSDSGQQIVGWRRATEYHKAGIKFKKREFSSENPHSLLDILFCNGEIEIPCLTIDPNTYCLFRSLVEFEQSCPEFGNSVTTYVVLLSRLIRKPEDVSLLTKTGIIVNHLNSDAEVFDIFASLSKSLAFDFNGNYCLRPLYHAMEAHYENQRSFTSRIHEWALSLVPRV